MLTLLICLTIILGIILIYFIISLVIHHKVFGNRFKADGIIKYYEQEEFPNLKSSNYEFSCRNTTLRGKIYYYPSQNYQGILVFAHGMFGSHQAYFQEIERLAQNGFKVLGFDYTGTELSDGKNLVGLANSLTCLNAAILAIKKSFPKDKIYVMGHSWGGFAATSIAKYHNDLAGIVAMSPFRTLAKAYCSLLPKYLYPCILFLVFIDYLKCGKIAFTNTYMILKKTCIPTLIIHSKDDRVVNYFYNTGYLKEHILNKTIKFLIVEGKNHNPDYTEEALEYTASCMASLKGLNEADTLAKRKNFNYHKMGEIDIEIFAKIISFLKGELR